MPDDFITRTEFEARLNEIRTDNRGLEAKIDTQSTLMYTLNTQLNTKIDSIKIDTWKVIGISAVNFIVGGGLFALVEFLVLRK